MTKGTFHKEKLLHRQKEENVMDEGGVFREKTEFYSIQFPLFKIEQSIISYYSILLKGDVLNNKLSARKKFNNTIYSTYLYNFFR